MPLVRKCADSATQIRHFGFGQDSMTLPVLHTRTREQVILLADDEVFDYGFKSTMVDVFTPSDDAKKLRSHQQCYCSAANDT